MVKLLSRILLVIIILGGVFAAYKFGLFSGNDELKIDKTAIVVDQVKKIGEFTSACYYEEMVVKQAKRSDSNDSGIGFLVNKVTNSEITDEIVILANGKVRAGFDLTKIKETDIRIQGDTLSINLPKAEIFDVIINPSGYEIYVEDGTWSHEEVTALETSATEKLEKNAKDFEIEKKASEIGITKLKALFKTFGVNEVIITTPDII